MSSPVIIQVGGISSQVIISTQNVGSSRVVMSPRTSTPTPEYWWRADVAGLTTTSWPASAGGLDMTLTNVSSANSTTGVLFNGSTGFGSTANLGVNIDAKHTFLRIDFTKPGAGTLKGLYGGSQNNIHQQAYFNSGGFFWYWIENLSTGLTWAARTTVDNQSIASWADFTNGVNLLHYEDNDVTSNTATTYVGTYNNRLRWQSGFNILLGRRQEGNYSNMYVKEFAIFTSALTTAQGTEFRDSMLTRWP